MTIEEISIRAAIRPQELLAPGTGFIPLYYMALIQENKMVFLLSSTAHHTMSVGSAPVAGQLFG